MKTITTPSPHNSSFSSSRRHFQHIIPAIDPDPARRPGPVSRIRTALSRIRLGRRAGPASRVIGTLFGTRRGHVRFAFQISPSSGPLFLVELGMPTASLVREMASGLVRIALECERGSGDLGVRLSEEGAWRAYCNGKKCGYGVRKECGARDWRVLRAVEMVSMGAGVLPAAKEEEGEGEMMYMRARFERVVGSRDSEAFYMMNPDGNAGAGPELSVYLLRV